MSNPVLSIKNVEKTYTSNADVLNVLKGVNLELAAGESIAIMGASGCGKSTLLNLVGGLDKVETGEINACGHAVSSLKEKELTHYRSMVVGFVFQFHYLLKDFTVLENVMLPKLVSGRSRREAISTALELLEQVGIVERKEHYPAQLSGGERQRAALARALVNDPKIILADEPTGNLDEEHKAIVADLIFDLPTRMGKSMLLVTHAADLAARANKVCLLKDGVLIPA